MSAGQESDQACENKDDGIEEKPQEANVCFAGVGRALEAAAGIVIP